MKKLVSLVLVLISIMSISAVAFAAEDIIGETVEKEQAKSEIVLNDGSVVQDFGGGIIFVYTNVEEKNRGILPMAYGTETTAYKGYIIDSNVNKYWLQVNASFNVTSSKVTCLSRNESHGVLDGSGYTFENPHAWHDPANGGSTCWAYATVTAKKFLGGILVRIFDFNVRVGYNTSGTRLTNQN